LNEIVCGVKCSDELVSGGVIEIILIVGEEFVVVYGA